MKEQYYGLILVKKHNILFQSCKKGFCVLPAFQFNSSA